MDVGYELLDSGDQTKLERFGEYVLSRPAPQAIWSRRLPSRVWTEADATFTRSPSGGGSWHRRRPLPQSWVLELGGLSLKIKPTDFGHLGVFPEQRPNWDWIARVIGKAPGPVSVLNLFAYTGGSTLVAAAAGATVCHLDSSRGVVAWARENAALSDLADRPVRWIVDDVTKFIRREGRRGRCYDAIILDPPSFGRGPKGEVWKIEHELPGLLHACRALLGDQPLFVLLSCHSPGFTPLVLRNLLAEMMAGAGGWLDAAEMALAESDGERSLPSGSFSRWVAGNEANDE